MSEFDDYIERVNKTGDIGPKGEVGVKISFDTHEFDYEFDETNDSEKSYADKMAYYIDDYSDDEYENLMKYDKQYDRLFDIYKRHDKKSKSKKKSTTLSDDEIAGFEHVKNYYITKMATKQKAQSNMIKIAKTLFLVTLTSITLVSLVLFLTVKSIDGSNNSYTYLTKQGDKSNQLNLIKQEPMNIAKPFVKVNSESIPSVVNNYNFDKLNSGLATLGYSLLICFIGLICFKGFSSFRKSLTLKKEFKKSKDLIDNFNLTISNQDSQLSVSQLINDQIVINNILIERLQKNNNVVELMAINEKLIDASNFINSNLITNLKGA